MKRLSLYVVAIVAIVAIGMLIMRSGESVALKILVECGVDLQAFYAEIAASVSGVVALIAIKNCSLSNVACTVQSPSDNLVQDFVTVTRVVVAMLILSICLNNGN